MTAQDRELIAPLFGILVGFMAGALVILVWAANLPARECAPMVCVDPGCALVVRSE